VLPFIATAASGAAPRDRDHDGLSDRWEKRYHLSTSKKSEKGDPDHDGLRNLREYRLRTNPRRKDTDRDGLRDRAEIRRYHTNPRKKDTDGDGYSDGAEVRAGTNPRDPKSHPTGSPTPTPPTGEVPGPGNTGVPPGTTLTPRTGPITVTTNGAVLEGLDITYTGPNTAVQVNADNVTIRNTRIRSNGISLIQNDTHTGLLVEDSELINRRVAGHPNCHNGIAMGSYTARRLEITGCENGAEMAHSNVRFERNWVHDLDLDGPSYVFGDAPPHADGVQLNGGASNVVIRNNNIDPVPSGRTGGTSGIIGNTSGDNVRIEDNRIDGQGSSYAIYAPRTAKSVFFINGNRLGRGVYGYTACVRRGVTVTSFSGNVDASTGNAVSADNGSGGGCSN
jgi:hypothetical protein